MNKKQYVKIFKEDIDFIKTSIWVLKRRIYDTSDDFIDIEKMIRRLYWDKSFIGKFKKQLLKKLFNIDIEKMYDHATMGFVKTGVTYEILMWGIRDKLKEAIKKGLNKPHDKPKNG